MNLLSLTRYRRNSRHWQVLFISLTRLTKTSTLHIKSYSDWHFRLVHIGFQHVQWLIRTGRLKVKINTKAVANCESTKCAACEFGKGCRRPNKLKTIKKKHMKEQELNEYHILPGQMVSADHYISWVLGRLYHTKGKSDPYGMLSGGCVLLIMPVVM